MADEKISTLHPLGEPDTDLYPNIKLENIPLDAYAEEAEEGSPKLVNGDLLYKSLLNKQDTLEYDVEPTPNSNNMVTSGGIYNYIRDSIVEHVKLKGSITFLELSLLTSASYGDMYNITDSFTLGGKNYDAGTNLVCLESYSAIPLDLENYWDSYGSSSIDLSEYQKSLIAGNLIVLDSENNISVDSDKMKIDTNVILGIDNTVDELTGHTAIVNTVLGYQNKISKDSIDGVIANTDILIGYKNETYSFNYYTTLLGQENYAYYAQNSLALGYKNKIGNRYSSPDENLIAIGNSNNVGNTTTKICKNIIGIGNNINNQDDYTFVIDTNASGTYGTNRSSLVGNLQGLYYNNEKMATETYVDEHSGGGGSPLQIHYIRQSYMTGDSSTFQTVNFAFYSYRSTSFSTYESLYTFLVNNNFTSKLSSLPCILAMGPGSTSNIRNGAITGIYADTTAGMIYGLYISYNSNYAGSITNGESVMQIKDPTNVSGSSSFFTDTVKPLV